VCLSELSNSKNAWRKNRKKKLILELKKINAILNAVLGKKSVTCYDLPFSLVLQAD
jgi:hypothetical protein